MPGASDCVREVLSQREAKECLAFDSVVRRQDPHQNLYAPEDHNHIEILQCRTLRRSWLECKEGIFFRIRPMYEFLLLRGVPPDKATDAGQQTDEAENAPEDGAGCWHIADQWFMRPIICVSCFGSRTFRAASPR